MSDSETRLPFPEYMLGRLAVEPPYVETDQVPLIRNGRTMWVPGSLFTALGGRAVFQILDDDPAEGPGAGLAVLYVVRVGSTAVMRMQVGIDPTPIDVVFSMPGAAP